MREVIASRARRRPLSHTLLRIGTASSLAAASIALAASFALAQAPTDSAKAGAPLAPTSRAAFRSVKAFPRNSVSEVGSFVAARRAAAERQEAADRAREALDAADRGKAKAGGEADGLGFAGAYQYYLKQRAFPNNKVDWSKYGAALAHQAKMPKAGTGNGAKGFKASPLAAIPTGPLPDAQWEYIGPKNYFWPAQRYYVSGRVNDVSYTYPATDPLPDMYSTYYLASATGGAWKSEDLGRNWKPLSDKWQYLHTSCVAVDPSNANNVLVGTGDFQGYGAYSFGIMKSTDGGDTWTNVGSKEFGDVAVSRIVYMPEDPSVVICTTGRGNGGYGYVWRSTDGGDTWTRASIKRGGAFVLGEWSGLDVGELFNTFGPGGFRTTRMVWAVASSGEIWYSTDEGQTWFSKAAPTGLGGWLNPDVAASKKWATSLYVLYPNPDPINPTDKKMYQWDLNANPPNWKDVTPGSVDWSQGWYDWYVRTSKLVDPDGIQDVVYCGLIDLVQSPKSGANWRSIANCYTPNELIHVDQHAMMIDPRDPDNALVGNDGGIYRLNFNPALSKWTFDANLSQTLAITQFYHTAYHPYDPNVCMGGTQDNSTPAALGDLGNWRNVGGGDGGYCAINPQNANYQYGSSQTFGVIYHTTNAWRSSDNIAPNFGTDLLQFIPPMTLDPGSPNLLYAGSNYLWRWNEKLLTWEKRLGGRKLSAQGALMTIAVAPSNGNYIYTGSDEGEIYMTSTGGQAWRLINKAPFPQRSITNIQVYPSNEKQVLVTVSGFDSGHVWQCLDTSIASPVWKDVSGSGDSGLPNIPTNRLTFDINDPVNTWYVATDIGVYYTTTAGKTWIEATNSLGLPNVQVSDIQAIPGTGYLNVGTFGRGIWRIRIGNPTSPVGSIQVVPTPVLGGPLDQSVANPKASAVGVTGTIALAGYAPQGGQTVTFTSDNPAVKVGTTATDNLLPSYTVPGGSMTRFFTFDTSQVTTQQTVTITAAAGRSKATTKIVVLPLPLTSLAVNPGTIGRSAMATGLVTLNVGAPAGGQVVTLGLKKTNATDPDPATALTIPGFVRVLAGNKTASFTLTAKPVTKTVTVMVTAKLGNVTKAALVTVTK